MSFKRRRHIQNDCKFWLQVLVKFCYFKYLHFCLSVRKLTKLIFFRILCIGIFNDWFANHFMSVFLYKFQSMEKTYIIEKEKKNLKQCKKNFVIFSKKSALSFHSNELLTLTYNLWILMINYPNYLYKKRIAYVFGFIAATGYTICSLSVLIKIIYLCYIYSVEFWRIIYYLSWWTKK